MLVFDKARLVFLAVPKTGTTAYHNALSPLASMVVRDPPLLKHSPVFRYNRFFRPALEKFVHDSIDVLAVMREPISWLGSWYRYRQRPFLNGRPTSTADISFDDFVQAYIASDQPSYANVGSQAKFLEPQKNGTAVTHLFRYEDQLGLNGFLEDRLHTTITLEQHNVSPEADLTLSSATDAALRQRYASDFTLWDGIKGGGDYAPIGRLPGSQP